MEGWAGCWVSPCWAVTPFVNLRSRGHLSQVVLVVKNPPAKAGDPGDVVSISELERFPEEGVATHSSILAWRILWTEEPGRLQSLGSQRARHDWSNIAHTQAPFLALVHQVMRIKWDNIYENPLKGKKHKQNWKHKAQWCVPTETRILARILGKLYFL